MKRAVLATVLLAVIACASEERQARRTDSATTVGASAADTSPLTAVAAPDPTEAAIQRIRARYATIERELPTYRCRTLDLEGFSAEGGELRACHAGDQLRKLSALHYGESGRAESHHYFWDGQLDFALDVSEQYTAHMSGVVAARTEQRFYFSDGRLVRWLGPGNVPQALDSPEATEEAARVLTLARQFAACAADPAARRCGA